MRRVITEDRLARALHAVDVPAGRAVSDDYDFGPAEYMRAIYKHRARLLIAAMDRCP